MSREATQTKRVDPVAVKNVAKLEPRTRVVFNLPVNSTGETRAFFEIIGHVQGLKDLDRGVTGFTYSDPMPAVFTGFWWSDEQIGATAANRRRSGLWPTASRGRLRLR